MSKQVAAEKIEISNRALSKIKPGEKARIIWDSKLTGFGVKVMPSGTVSFLVNYRTNGGGRGSPNKRMVIGRQGTISVAMARQKAQQILGSVAGGKDPSSDRQDLRATPTLADVFDGYMKANPNRKPRTNELYRYEMDRYLGDWQNKPINQIKRADIQDRFNLITFKHGQSPANRIMSLLRSIYRAPCAENEALRNPVEIWLAGGGRFNRKTRRKIDTPSEILPKWEKGFAVIQNQMIFDAIYVGLYTGMRLREILWLKWDDIQDHELSVEETKTGETLRLPITTQLAKILDRRKLNNDTEWVFPNADTKTGHMEDLHHVYPTITKAAKTKFWFHALRNCLITIAERDLGIATSLTKRLVNHARPQDVTEGYAADWTVKQLRGPAQAIADRIDTLMEGEEE